MFIYYLNNMHHQLKAGALLYANGNTYKLFCSFVIVSMLQIVACVTSSRNFLQLNLELGLFLSYMQLQWSGYQLLLSLV